MATQNTYFYHRHIPGAYCKVIAETARGCKVLQTGTCSTDKKKPKQAFYDAGDMAGPWSLWIQTNENNIPDLLTNTPTP